MTTRQRTVGLGTLLVVYLIAALLIGFWSTPVDGLARGWLLAHLDALHLDGLPDAITYGTVESAANVVFFVPLGMLLTVILPKRLWFVAIVAGVGFSCAIELGQYLFLPSRFATWADVAANTAGAAVGVVLVLLTRGVLALARRRSR
ncbi:VanZ family protein [Lacisediminihabitans changchengi]|uniref:VanZ family protein n=1 Tax=Lacisediminihabitans changchengi TaxID=2787634 RepID=A0A934W4Y9_9MICO|nr:VanZ family protein [Lacisediminihabitans changchengi]MBK4348769.1 VanZ family protein [Lacisediminihabitans changchengi]